MNVRNSVGSAALFCAALFIIDFPARAATIGYVIRANTGVIPAVSGFDTFWSERLTAQGNTVVVVNQNTPMSDPSLPEPSILMLTLLGVVAIAGGGSNLPSSGTG